jgi:aconitase A
MRSKPCPNPGNFARDLARQLQVPQDPESRVENLSILQPQGCRAQGLEGASKLPFSLKVLLENLIRHEDGRTVSKADLKATVDWLAKRRSDREIAFRPARVLMQDFTGVPAVVDLAAMRDAMRGSAAIRTRSTRWCRSISSSTIR